MEWKEVTLGDFMQCNPKRTIKKGQKARKITMDLLIPHSKTIRNWNYEPYSGGAKFQNGDTIMARITPCLENGKHAFVSILNKGEIAYGSTEYFVFCGKEDVSDNDFVYYLTKTPLFRDTAIKSMVGSSGRQRAQMDVLENLKMLVPKDISDQRRIASILSSLDRKIELNNKINADLEEMAQAIFKNWLSECSDEVTIGELSLNITNYEKTDAEEVVLINSSDVTEGYSDHHNYSPNKNLKGHFKKRFQKGDILYSQVRPRNRHWAYCNFDANDYLASTQLMVIRNNPSLITSILLYQYIISDNVWKEFTLKTETRSGTFPQGNYEDLSQIRVPYNSDVEGISNQLETLYAKMFMLEKESSRLSLLRDTLLPRLMSGEIEVPE